MPKLWNETVEGHRAAVRQATLDATATLVGQRGLSAVTMSEVAKRAGIGRATLYKYFPDVESILTAWHERQIGTHLQHLVEIRDKSTDAGQRLEEVLHAFALTNLGSHDSDISTLLHQGQYVTEAHRQLHGLLEGLIAEAVSAGRLRDDVPPAELASYCVHALTSASSLTSRAAVRRLVAVTLAGMSYFSADSD
jgi:AcrR family transcriptional regulator